LQNNRELQEVFETLDQEHDSEDEGMEDYKIGGKANSKLSALGYHPVHIGEVLL
jgi:serine/threonine-protein kinase SRPK3